MEKVIRKDFRELTVSEATNYGRRTAPMLRIQRLWLQELGFNVGAPVLVKCENGKLIITLDTTRVGLIEAVNMECNQIGVLDNMGKIVLIGTTKGSVGKSVSSYNLAYSLAKLGKKVLTMMRLQDFLKTIKKIKSRINPRIEIEGILLTMCEARTNLCKVISEQVADTFEGQIRVFKSKIPNTVKVGESVYYSEPLLEYAPNSKACKACQAAEREIEKAKKKRMAGFEAYALGKADSYDSSMYQMDEYVIR